MRKAPPLECGGDDTLTFVLQAFLFDIPTTCNEKHCIKRHDANSDNAPFPQRYARSQIVNLKPNRKCAPYTHSSNHKPFFHKSIILFSKSYTLGNKNAEANYSASGTNITCYRSNDAGCSITNNCSNNTGTAH